MPEPDEPKESTATPDGRSPAQIFFEDEFSRCRERLLPSEQGVEAMRRAQEAFDAVWAEVVRNAGCLFGRSATRDALEAMGRPEDAS